MSCIGDIKCTGINQFGADTGDFLKDGKIESYSSKLSSSSSSRNNITDEIAALGLVGEEFVIEGYTPLHKLQLELMDHIDATNRIIDKIGKEVTEKEGNNHYRSEAENYFERVKEEYGKLRAELNGYINQYNNLGLSVTYTSDENEITVYYTELNNISETDFDTPVSDIPIDDVNVNDLDFGDRIAIIGNINSKVSDLQAFHKNPYMPAKDMYDTRPQEVEVPSSIDDSYSEDSSQEYGLGEGSIDIPEQYQSIDTNWEEQGIEFDDKGLVTDDGKKSLGLSENEWARKYEDGTVVICKLGSNNQPRYYTYATDGTLLGVQEEITNDAGETEKIYYTANGEKGRFLNTGNNNPREGYVLPYSSGATYGTNRDNNTTITTKSDEPSYFYDGRGVQVASNNGDTVHVQVDNYDIDVPIGVSTDTYWNAENNSYSISVKQDGLSDSHIENGQKPIICIYDKDNKSHIYYYPDGTTYKEEDSNA